VTNAELSKIKDQFATGDFTEDVEELGLHLVCEYEKLKETVRLQDALLDQKRTMLDAKDNRLKHLEEVLERISTRSFDDVDEAAYPIKRFGTMTQIIKIARAALEVK
jgi:hypothetical protein